MSEERVRPAYLRWTTLAPVLAVLALALTWGRDVGTIPLVIVAVLLGAAVLAAVQHAEIVEAGAGDLVVLMSNGGFGGIHQKLLQALAA